MPQETEMEENIRASLAGMESTFELTKVVSGKTRGSRNSSSESRSTDCRKRRSKRMRVLKDEDNTEEQGEEEPTRVVNFRENSERNYYKDLVQVIERSDVLVEVLDARDPIGTRCTDMERMVMQAGPSKHLVLLLNKIDLVPREAAEKWLSYLREEFPAVAFKCSTQEQRSNLGWKSSKASKPSNLLQISDCLGADTLIKLLKNYTRSHELKKSITVGIIGLPNVGKSSLINSLKRAHVVNGGSTPGLTRSLQEVNLDKNVKLIDFLYKISTFEAVDDFLYKVTTVRGKLKKGGLVDIKAAARIT